MTTKIYIDAGHGGRDSGAAGNGLLEKNIVLDLSKRIEKLLSEYKDVEVMQSRARDNYLSLNERTAKANSWGADCLVSLHINAAENKSAKGFESFIWNGEVGSETVAFQNVMHKEILSKIRGESGVVDRGTKRANFHMVRESKMKAVLTENLFISNVGDTSHLKKETFLNKLAEGHVLGLEKFFGLERAIRPPTETDPNTGDLWRVITGTFSSRENAEKRVEDLKKDGYESYILKKE